MFIFGLRSTSDDRLSDPSNESRPKCEKEPLSHQKMKCLFWDYVQLLMNAPAILVMKCDQNVKNEKIGFINKMTFWFWEILLHVDHSVR